MIKTLLVLLICLTFSSVLRAQENSYVAQLPLMDGPSELGEVQAEIKNEKVSWVDKQSLVDIIRPRLTEDTLAALMKLPPRISPNLLPFPMRFDPERFVIETTLKIEMRAKQKTNLGVNLDDLAAVALSPAPFGGSINYNLEKSWAAEELGGNAYNGQFTSFVNMNSLVLESQSFYQNNSEHDKWFRGDTRLVKDFQSQQVRSQVGDIYPGIQGFMVSRPLGGLNVQRNFSLNPYRLPYPTGRQDFTIKSRSLVRYFVNSVLIKTEYLPPGNYSASDIPLNNGLNTVLIEATDDLGQKQIFRFRSASSINLLNQGEARFDLSYGTPFKDTGVKREYIEEEGKLLSGFMQYGFTRTFSSTLYVQNQLDFMMAGTEMIGATTIGNVTVGVAETRLGQFNGRASSLGYQLITQGDKWFDSHTLTLRYENRSEEFRGSFNETSSSIQNFYAMNYTIPLSNLMTVSIGGNQGDVRDNSLQNRYGIDANLGLRLFKDHALSAFVSRNRDEFGNWNDTAYVFLTLTFPEKNSYFTTLYDHEQKNTRLSYLRDNQNRLNTLRTQLTAESAEETKGAELDVLYPTTFASLGVRGRTLKKTENDEIAYRGAVRLTSAFVFAYQDGEMAAGLSRSVPGSFVIFSPEQALKGQQISLRSSSPYNEAATGLFGEITYSNLLAYQYRDIQLDPSMMDEGRSLVREKFVLFPTYRSAHLIKLQERGSVSLTGRLVDQKGAPISLAVGSIGQVTFFTNRDGVFFIEGISPGPLQLKLDGRDDKIQLAIGKEKRGLVDLGQLQFKDDL